MIKPESSEILYYIVGERDSEAICRAMMPPMDDGFATKDRGSVQKDGLTKKVPQTLNHISC
jgi:hypothetical protein